MTRSNTAAARAALLLASVAVLVLGGLATGCKPTYPKCDNDGHCKQGERCLNGMCQQCAADNDCPSGTVCQAGRCNPAGNACKSDADCPPEQACKRGVCSACTADADCGPGGRCKRGACVRPGRCPNGDEDCPEGQKCLNGVCQAPAAPPTACQLENIYFDFNESALSTTASAALQKNADCIKTVGRKVAVEGHADPRGTTEYNLALGERRAQSVKKYLSNYGIDPTKLRTLSKGKEEATGTDEAGWSRDRKVHFIWE